MFKFKIFKVFRKGIIILIVLLLGKMLLMVKLILFRKQEVKVEFRV